MNSLEDLIKQLPRELREEVKDFTEFLLEKQLKKQRKKPTFDWAGVMKDLRSEYASEGKGEI